MTILKDSAAATHPVHHIHSGVMRFDEFESLYTEPKVALWELRRRRKEKALTLATRQNLGQGAAEILKKFREPRAIFFRQIATPTHETLRFLKLAKQLKLKPLILEYYDDKFVSAENRSKRSLAKMPLYQYTGSDGRDMVKYATICDFNAITGKKFKDITCLGNEKLVAYHHRLFKKIIGLDPKRCTFDASDWFKSTGGKPEHYYEHILTLLIRDGILFENFMPLRSESAFTKKVVVPAFEKMKTLYGVQPLIVRLLPENEEMRLFWDSYPPKIEKHIWI